MSKHYLRYKTSRHALGIILAFICQPDLIHARHFELENLKTNTKLAQADITSSSLEISRGEKVVNTDADALSVGPGVTLRVRVSSGMPTGKVAARVYYFQPSLGRMRRIVAPVEAAPVPRDGEGASAIPAYLDETTAAPLRFPLPAEVLRTEGWRGIVVVGDDRDATAALFGDPRQLQSLGTIADYDFPEKPKCLAPSPSRPPESSPLLEIACHPGLPDYPKMTLFARLPAGMDNGRQAQGVLCLSLLAGSLDEVRRNLVNHRAQGHVADMLRYADKNKLIVVCWGARRLWDAGKNWDELSPEAAKLADRRFDRVAAAWESGIRRLADIHRFEPKDFIIWGYSASAQFAKRLVLRKPQYFRAAYLHIPSSFDAPTPEAASVVWCLTTGEQESGYVRSLKFVRECRKLGYPLVYKAVPFLGHTDHTPSRILGLQVLDYARSLPVDPQARATRIAQDRAATPFYGDYLNQIMEPADKADWMPKNLKLPLVTPLLAQAWLMDPDHPAPDPSPAIASLPPEPAAGPAEALPTTGLADFVAPEATVTRAAHDPWADYLAGYATAKKMRAMGVAWSTPAAPTAAVPPEHRDALRQLAAEAEKTHASDLKLAAAMRAAGRAWPDPAKPAILTLRDSGALTGQPPGPTVETPAPTPVAPAAPTTPRGDNDNTPFGRRIR